MKCTKLGSIFAGLAAVLIALDIVSHWCGGWCSFYQFRIAICPHHACLGWNFIETLPIRYQFQRWGWDNGWSDLSWRPVLLRDPWVGNAVVFPIWNITLLIVVLYPVLLRFRRKTDPSLCTCGYNLTGNISAVCPECGKPIAESVTP